MATSTALKHRPSLSSTKSSTNTNTNTNNTNTTKFSCDPHVLYILQGIVRDLQFLCDGGYITRMVLDEIIDKLPKPMTHFIPNNTPAASPSPSPVGMHNLPSEINTQVTVSRASVNSTSNTDSQTDSPLMKDDDFFDVDEEIMKRNVNGRFEDDDESAIAYGVSSTGEEASYLDGRMEYMREAEERSLRSLASTTDHEAITTQSDVTSQSSQNRRMMRSPAPSTTSSHVVNTNIHPGPVNDMYPNSSASSPTETYAPSRTTAISSLALPPPAGDAPMPQRGQQNGHVQTQSQQPRSRRASSVAAPAYLAIVEALWEFADDDGDLTFRKGDVLEVIEFVNSDWWRGRCLRTGKMGIFPRVYARILHMNQTGSSFHHSTSTYYTTRPQIQHPSPYSAHAAPQNAQV